MHEELLDEALRALDGEDDEALRVYADWLAGQGDPRGELIQLQLLPETPARWKRQKRLLREHGEAWLGDAAPMLTRVTWRRGFPYEATLSYALPRRPETLETLRILHCRRGDRHHREQTGALLVHPVLHELRQVDGPIAVETLEAWLTGDPRPLLRLEAPLGLLQLAGALQTLAAQPTGLPDLQVLTRREASHPRQWRHLLRTPLGRALTRLEVRCNGATLPAWLGSHADLELKLTLGNDTLTIERTRDRLEVDASLGRLYEGGASVATAELLAQVLTTLPANRFDQLEIRWPRAYAPTPEHRTALAEQVDRLRR